MSDAPPTVGAPAPSLAGTLAGGGSFRLDALRGRPALVEFHRGTW